MEWWLPFALMGAALLVPMLLAPQPRRRRDSDDDVYDDEWAGDDRVDDRSGNRRDSRGSAQPASSPPRRMAGDPNGVGFGPMGVSGGDKSREKSRKKASKAAPEPARRAVSTSYVRDPAVLDDWPQADAVLEVMRAFTDRWGADDDTTTSMFRRVEPVGGSNEQAFAFVVDPDGKGKETSLLARACLSSAEAQRPSRLWVTKYFDHIGERFRADVAKTPQHSRGIIAVRDVPPDRAGKGSVALEYIASLTGDPYDDIHVEDVTQFKNLINIMRMFS